MCLVAAVRLAAVKVRVDARVGLVQGVRLVRAGGVGGWAGGVVAAQRMRAVGGAMGAVSTGGTMDSGAAVGVADCAAGVPVTVDAGVGGVGQARLVGTVLTLTTAAVVVAGSVAKALAAAVGVDARVGLVG